MQITLEVLFSPRLKALLEEDKPNGVELTILPVRMQRDFDFTPVATVVVGFASNVAAGLFVHWLLKKIPEKARKKITIRNRETVWDEGELTRIIEEEIQIEIDGDSSDEKKPPHD
ncbi:MAG TPA: hypothetical protein VJU77_06595 [Chthoniobacterales bacterium]|nr:hypothetical protein [Chthoniobacterales bacterium]